MTPNLNRVHRLGLAFWGGSSGGSGPQPQAAGDRHPASTHGHAWGFGLPLLLLMLASAPLTLEASRISEPDTTFYGRIVSRTALAEFPVTQGELVWTLVVPSQNNRQYQLKASLEVLAAGRYSYRLHIPHQVLAYDLTAADKFVPLTAAGLPMRHLQVLVNGRPARIEAPATDSFTAQQAARAGAYRIDLVLADDAADSDGDGIPDWWEDQNGFDKWDPRDAALALSKLNGGGNSGNTGGAPKTLAEWRTAQFPGEASDLEAFSREDRNADGIPHVLEYAFGLDPKAPAQTAQARPNLPHMANRDGAMALIFNKRASATDLDYLIEVTQDLVTWRSAAAEVEPVELSAAEQENGTVCFRDKQAGDGAQSRFFRVRVAWKP